jgi:hypothetical protein
MKTIETTGVVTDDHRLALQLPEDVTPGEHRIVLLIDEPKPAANHDQNITTPMRWEGNVLVYDGQYSGSLEQFIEELREERIRQFFPENAT